MVRTDYSGIIDRDIIYSNVISSFWSAPDAEKLVKKYLKEDDSILVMTVSQREYEFFHKNKYKKVMFVDENPVITKNIPNSKICDIRKLDSILEPHVVDCALSFGSIQLFSLDDRIKIYNQIVRVLKSEGKALLTYPPTSFCEYFSGLPIYNPGEKSLTTPLGKMRYFSGREEIESELSQDFKIVEFREVELPKELLANVLVMSSAGHGSREAAMKLMEERVKYWLRITGGHGLSPMKCLTKSWRRLGSHTKQETSKIHYILWHYN